MTSEPHAAQDFALPERFNLRRIPAWIPIALYSAAALLVPWLVDRNEVPAELQPVAFTDTLEEHMRPSEHAWMMRAWPDGKIDIEAYERALAVAASDEKLKRQSAAVSKGGASWDLEGPTNIGGRINTIAVDPLDANVIYAGNCNGGIHKTTDGGMTWNPVFDVQPFLAIGDIEIDPNNSNTVYAGTGDPNITGFPFLGDGVWKSTDAGVTWTSIGLTSSRIISRLEVHPLNSNLIYAGAMGFPFERNSDRGLYKSTDGGSTWVQVFYENDSTGVIDMAIDPTNPDRIWITTWNRLRSQFSSLVYGPDAAVYRSDNGGATWTKLGGGLPTGWQCRPGIHANPANPDHLVVQFVGTSFETEGVYETFDGGNSWSSLGVSDLSSALGGFGWYFAKVRMNPFDSNRKYILGVSTWWTNDGGANWNELASPWGSGVHADKHDMVFLGLDEILLATDGGLFHTADHGTTWTRFDDIPNTQFYHAAVNPHVDREYWGGTQDNGTLRGGLTSVDSWDRMYGGDGFHVEFHAENPDIIWAEYQYGNMARSLDGGFSFDNATNGVDAGDRRNWDFPFILSPHNPDRTYAGTYRLYRSEGTFVDFNTISPDLTKGILTFSGYHTLSTLRESAITEGLLFTGSSDGRVMRSEDAGGLWADVSAGLPNRYVTDIETSALDDNRLFVTHSGYKDNDNTPLIHRSDDRGGSWTDISGDLPPLALNDMEAYPGNEDILFVATDGGVYFSLDGGADWERLGSGMPVITVADVELDLDAGRLLAGTHARSMLSIDLSDVTPNQLAVIPPTDAAICEGESVELNVSGGLIYQWLPTSGLSCNDCESPVAAPSSSTTYSVTVSDGLGHSVVHDVTVEVTPLPETPVITQVGDSLFANSMADSYQWFVDGIMISGADEAFFVASAPGAYTVEAYSAAPASCAVISESYAFSPALGLPELLSNLRYYPNPATDVLHIDHGQSAGFRAFLFSPDGRRMLSADLEGARTSLDVSLLDAGQYVLGIMDGNGRTVFSTAVLIR